MNTMMLLALVVVGQADRRGEETTTSTTYHNVTASAPIPPEMHIKNEGGSDGAGLCVISSILCNGQYQNVPSLVGQGKQSALWKTAKSRPGGYGPEKLARLVEQVMPGETYASYTDTNPSILDQLSRKGYPIGATMKTGALYNYMPIHHMISLIHYRKNEYACVVDNNDPGRYHWMPAAEFDRRWVDGGTGWAWIWTRLPKATATMSWVAWFPVVVALALVLVKRRQARIAAAAIILGSAPVQAQSNTVARIEIPASARIIFSPQATASSQPPPQQQQPVDESPHEEDQESQDATNYGLDMEHINAEPIGSVLTNDPNFSPSMGAMAGDQPAAIPAAEAGRGFTFVVVVVAAVSIVFSRVHRDRSAT